MCKLPAVCARPESSESRSQSRSGLIPASSFRSSSDSDTFELQETALVVDAERAIRAEPVGRHDAVTGNDDREPVPSAERSRCTLRVRTAGECRQLAVRHRLAAADPAERLRQLTLELRRAVELDRHVEEVVWLAREVAREPLGERVVPAARLDRGPGQLVVQQTIPFEPDLPHAPAGRFVARVRGGHPRNRRITAMSAPGIFRPPTPTNEPVKEYAPGSPEREQLRRRLDQMQSERIELPLVIGGENVTTGTTAEVVMPHKKSHVLADAHQGDQAEVEKAIRAAADAWEDWSRLPWEERAAVFLRAAELLSGPWRATLNAATMLGQSKTAHQAEIDAACELTDFWRFNVEYMLRIYAEQPLSGPGTWNRMEYRPLEGFVFAVTPFNFTAIGGNLPTSAALMGNTVVWKPASTAAYSAHFLMKLYEEAGLPPGVINLLYGSGAEIGDPALASPDLAGVHFTGSTPVFQSMWRTIGNNIARYRSEEHTELQSH